VFAEEMRWNEEEAAAAGPEQLTCCVCRLPGVRAVSEELQQQAFAAAARRGGSIGGSSTCCEEGARGYGTLPEAACMPARAALCDGKLDVGITPDTEDKHGLAIAANTAPAMELSHASPGAVAGDGKAEEAPLVASAESVMAGEERTMVEEGAGGAGKGADQETEKGEDSKEPSDEELLQVLQ